MKERTAVGLVYVGAILLEAIVFIGSVLLGASERVLAIVWLIPLCLGAWVVSEVTMYYGHRRDERHD